MSLASTLRWAWEKKTNFIQILSGAYTHMEYPAKDFVALNLTGFRQNATVRSCSDKIAHAVGSVPWKIQRKQGGKWVDVDDRTVRDLRDLLARPNINQSQRAVKELVVTQKLIGGFGILVRLDPSQPLSNRVIEVTKNKPVGLHVLPPHQFRQIMGNGGIVEYAYDNPDGRIRFKNNVFAPNPALFSQCCPFYIPDPQDNTRSCSPLVSVGADIDLVNEGKLLNLNMLKNGMRASGMLYAKGKLSPESKRALESTISTKYASSANAGKMPILESGTDGDIKYVDMSMTQKDADYIKGINNADRAICLVMGVPPIMMNVTGDSTYQNYEEANQAFWLETVSYHCATLAETVGEWLCPLYGDDLRIAPDYEQAAAMQNAQLDTMGKLSKVPFMTENEKRKRVGLDEIDDSELENNNSSDDKDKEDDDK